MRTLLTTLFATLFAASLAVSASVPTQAATHTTPGLTFSALTTTNPQYICDGNGAGSCKSLLPHSLDAPGVLIYAIGASAGAWRWDVYLLYRVTCNGGCAPFRDPSLDSQLAGQEVLEIALYASNDTNCNGNSAGGDILKSCTNLPASEVWVSDTHTGYLINVGRTNDKGTLEVLCNPGGGVQLTIVTPGSCTPYHEEWASN
jgi:hypothetical protein